MNEHSESDFLALLIVAATMGVSTKSGNIAPAQVASLAVETAIAVFDIIKEKNLLPFRDSVKPIEST